ncbi:MAG: sulfotransferase [Verrucomicrobiota bacterium]
MRSSSHGSGKVKKINIFACAKIKELEVEISAAWLDRDLEKCIQLLHQVSKLSPQGSDALFLIGRAHGMRFEYDEAIDSFDKAVEAAPKRDRSLALLKAGNMARNFFDPVIAESYFEQSVELAEASPAKLALAEHSFRIRKKDVAMELVDELLASHPEDPGALLLWCRLHENQFEECMDKLNMIVARHSGDLQAKAAYQVAKMHDAAGDYSGAMDVLAIAKAALMPARGMVVQSRSAIRARHLELAQGLTSARYKEWMEDSEQVDPNHRLALLCGHPRSGTTLLEQVLDSHPDVVSAEESEVFYTFAFAPLIRNQFPNQNLLTGLDALMSTDLISARKSYFEAMDLCLGQPVGSRLLIDKNPSLTSLIPGFFRIFSEAKFITLIRDPRDVILSCYMQSFVPVSGVSGNYLTLEDAASEYLGVMGVWNEIACRFGENACEVRYEDLVEDLAGNAKRVLDFLGLDWSDEVMGYDGHAKEKVIRSPTAAAVTEKVHSRAKNRWRNYEKHLEPVFDQLEPILKKLGYA